MTLRKFLGLVLSLLLILLLVWQFKFVLTKKDEIRIKATEEYKEDILKNINERDSVITNLKQKLDSDGIEIKAMDDSASLQLFIELSMGK